MIKLRYQIVSVLLLSALNACSYLSPTIPDGKKEWQKGWSDGCNFVRAFNGHSNAWEIDVSRRYADPDYDLGVRDGISACEEDSNASELDTNRPAKAIP